MGSVAHCHDAYPWTISANHHSGYRSPEQDASDAHCAREFLSLKEQDFVLAARALRVSDRAVIFRHALPNTLAPVVVAAILGVGYAIILEASASFPASESSRLPPVGEACFTGHRH